MIDILLSTYQSEKYLEILIESLLNQEYTDWNLLIRDDGSTDNTIKILNVYQKNYPTKIYVLPNTKENVGVIKSFEHLLKYSNAEYLMFCDHDDIWLPKKIEISIQKMIETEKANPNLPILVHTDLTVVNSDTEVINPSFWKFSKLNPTLLSRFNYLGVCNGITGCTVILNSKAKEICLPFSKHALMHDSWVALCISKYGKIAYVDKSTILYRQHELNKIGAKEIKSVFEYFRARLRNLKQVINENNKQFELLKELQYGTKFKYYYFKILYFIKARL